MPSNPVRQELPVALVVPLSGPLGLAGPSSINCALLAAEELAGSGRALGREVRFEVVDGGAPPETVARRVGALLARRQAEVVVGMHTSAVRSAVAATVAGRVPYIYTPPYEGGASELGFFSVGETPGRQLGPALAWLVDKRRARRWALVGNDYLWPRQVHAVVRDLLGGFGASVVDERYLPFSAGEDDVERCVEGVGAAAPDGLLLELVGQELVTMLRVLRGHGLDRRTVRLSASLEENVLLGLGGDDTGGLFAAMGFFASLPTDASLDFAERYHGRFGPDAPALNVYGESCHEGLLLLGALVDRAGSTAVHDVVAAGAGSSFAGARGPLTVVGGHVHQPIHLARASGLDLEVVASW